jgi:hypothetical protein
LYFPAIFSPSSSRHASPAHYGASFAGYDQTDAAVGGSIHVQSALPQAAACVRVQALQDCLLVDLGYEILMMDSPDSAELAPFAAQRSHCPPSTPLTICDSSSRCAQLISSPLAAQDAAMFPSIFAENGSIIFSDSNCDAWRAFLMHVGIRDTAHSDAILQHMRRLQQRGVRVQETVQRRAAHTDAAPIIPQPHQPWPMHKLSMTFTTAPRVVLLSTGALNPVHLGHINAMVRAKAHLKQIGYDVVGGFMSPTHDDYVRPKMEHQVKAETGLTISFVRN